MERPGIARWLPLEGRLKAGGNPGRAQVGFRLRVGGLGGQSIIGKVNETLPAETPLPPLILMIPRRGQAALLARLPPLGWLLLRQRASGEKLRADVLDQGPIRQVRPADCGAEAQRLPPADCEGNRRGE